MTAYAAPLRAVDELRVTVHDGRWSVEATKDVVADDPYLPAHFPDRTVYPGVFVLETVRQAVRAAVGRDVDLRSVWSLRLLGALHPGDRLLITALVDPADLGTVEATGRRMGDDAVVARLVLGFADA